MPDELARRLEEAFSRFSKLRLVIHRPGLDDAGWQFLKEIGSIEYSRHDDDEVGHIVFFSIGLPLSEDDPNECEEEADAFIKLACESGARVLAENLLREPHRVESPVEVWMMTIQELLGRTEWEQRSQDYSSYNAFAASVEAWRILNQNYSEESHDADESASSGQSSQSNRKRSTNRGDARPKIISALSRHHSYEGEGGISLDPVGVNELAREAQVSNSTVSGFFKREFVSYSKYRTVYCRDAETLEKAIRLLRGEQSPSILYQRIRDDISHEDVE